LSDPSFCLLPAAKRPHYQEGFLVGHYPIYDLDKERLPKLKEESNLNRRLIAIFELNNSDSGFWMPDYPRVERKALYPDDKDLLYKNFKEKFGEDAECSLQKVAQSFSGL